MLTLKLPHFEGPLELLQALVQKEEIDIYQLEIRTIVKQILEHFSCPLDDLEQAAESMGQASHLLWVKSRSLLPREEQNVWQEEEQDLPLTLFEQLVEYCRFKEAARQMASYEEKSYLRAINQPGEIKKPLGIEHLSLNDLAMLFQDLLQKAKEQKGVISEEEWRVTDKIAILRQMLKDYKKIAFEILFSVNSSKLELIVLFLAVLELMKIGELYVFREEEKVYIHILAQ